MASGLALAESDQNRAWCKGEGEPTADQQITSCTSLIESGSYRGQDLARTYFSRAAGYLRKRDLDRAIKDLDAGLALDPNNAAALYNRAVGYETKGDPDRALKDYDAAIKLKPDHLKALTNRGAIYFKKGDYDHAIEDQNRVVALNSADPTELRPSLASALYGRGVAKLRKGENASGEADVSAAKAIKPNVAEEFARYGLR
jgi:tetratricopeptide (TPR) repeat protein